MNENFQFKESGPIVGILLAGGQARRFGGGDKCLKILNGQSLLHRVIERAVPQVNTLILNAPGDGQRFGGIDLDLIEDCIEGGLGPLAGILTGMEWAKAYAPNAQWLASFATDAPFLPLDMVARLQDEAGQHHAKIAVARSNGRSHPVFALWRIDLALDLRISMVEQGMRKVMTWVESQDHVVVDFPVDPVDPFFNINTEHNLREAEDLLNKEMQL